MVCETIKIHYLFSQKHLHFVCIMIRLKMTLTYIKCLFKWHILINAI